MSFFGNNGKNLLEIGPFTITLYAFFIMLGASVAAYMAMKEAEKLGIDKNKILDGVLIGVPLGIVGARLYYVLFEWDNVTNNGKDLGNIFRIQDGGLAITGGIIVTIIFVYLYAKKKELNLLKIFDVVAPAFLVGQAFGRWGNFFNKEAYGGIIKNIDFMYNLLPDFIMDGMFISGYYRHPTFLYECLWNLLGVVLILIARNKLKKVQIGDFGAFYLIWYGFGRATLIEPFRTDALMMGNIRINVLIPALMCVGGIAFLIVKHIKFPQNLYLDEKNNTLERNKLEEEQILDN